jgi:serine/threonine protein kinase
LTEQEDFTGQNTLLSGISGARLSYLPGDIVDNAYQLTKLLGRGGMGVVFACRHIVMDKVYALKLLSGDQLSSQAWTRFQMEAQALARLNHPGIVGIYNMGIDKDQCPYYVMDLVAGEPLGLAIHRSGTLPVDTAMDIFIQVADALASAHLQGIVHRDIKPSNLILVQDDQKHAITVKLVDFGIARLSKQDVVTQSQTATGLIFGTPFYMSPEQCQGSRVDERSDIYSLGCTLFETLTGAPPFVGDNAFHTFLLHQTEAPKTLKAAAPNGDFSPSLEVAVQKMLGKSPGDRYQTMAQVKHDLERIRVGKPIMAQGLSTTIAPASSGANDKTVSRPATIVPDDVPADQANADRGDSDFEGGQRLSSLAKLAMVGGLLFALAAGSSIGLFLFSKAAKPQADERLVANFPKPLKGQEASSVIGTKPNGSEDEDEVYSRMPIRLLRRFGASTAEIQGVDENAMAALQDRVDEFKQLLHAHFKDPQWASAKFMVGGAFHFPTDIFIGSISIDGQTPQLATRAIKCPAQKSAFLYLITATKGCPQLLDKFGPNDLTGLAMVFDNPKEAIDRVRKWPRLKDLYFFNPLLKAMPNVSEPWDEAKINDQDLPAINRFTGLRSLGLCSPVTGQAILDMPLLKKLEGLTLKRINDFQPLFQALPKLDNLKELGLIHQNTTDVQLETIGRMKNLERLTIKRSSLTPDSHKYFKKMQRLKFLCLDRNDWTQVQKDDLKKLMPNCRIIYETVVDPTYWPMVAKPSKLPGKNGFKLLQL